MQPHEWTGGHLTNLNNNNNNNILIKIILTKDTYNLSDPVKLFEIVTGI